MIKKFIHWNIFNKGTNLFNYSVVLAMINVIYFNFEPIKSEIGTLIHYFIFSIAMFGGILKSLYGVYGMCQKDLLQSILKFLAKITLVIFSFGFLMMFVKFLIELGAFFK